MARNPEEAQRVVIPLGSEEALARLERALTALATGNRALAERVLAEYPEVLAEVEASREAHLRRLRDRVETRASTLTHLDLLTEREGRTAGLLLRYLQDLGLLGPGGPP